MIYTIMKVRELATIEEFDNFISEFVNDYIKSQDKDVKTAMKHFLPFMDKLVDIRGAMHK